MSSFLHQENLSYKFPYNSCLDDFFMSPYALLCSTLMLYSYTPLLCFSHMPFSYALLLCSTLMLDSYALLLCPPFTHYSYLFFLFTLCYFGFLINSFFTFFYLFFLLLYFYFLLTSTLRDWLQTITNWTRMHPLYTKLSNHDCKIYHVFCFNFYFISKETRKRKKSKI